MAEQETEFDVEQFIYIKIPAPIQPLDRGHLFEDPIDAAIEPRDLGHVSGGGSLLGDARSDGSRPIEFCGIDIDTTDRTEVLRILRDLLPKLGIPLDTELHYTTGGLKLQDRFMGADWAIGEPREFLHPGFDI
ncbi:hypothetical protein FCE95_11270 [Luteimonas gilva]|uniref:Uncharacterized protein n=1 Tax=Luteimonas gilva TaxID=2572684 RepID=A0A4U5JLZ6_9GAMM|nr:hypothetical protein [Luteimonas gilva]TKR30680.1 hypothetical protein FCE95_11270 [Luteimonas gilva]